MLIHYTRDVPHQQKHNCRSASATVFCRGPLAAGYLVCAVTVAAIIVSSQQWQNLVSLVGLCVFVFCGFLLSRHKRQVSFRLLSTRTFLRELHYESSYFCL